MSDVIIYHNPKCSKSRQTLALLEERNIEVEVIQYLKEPLSVDLIESLLKMLDLEPRELMRSSEGKYKELGLAEEIDRDRLVKSMVDYPILIERPIVVNNGSARIGRPPESVLEIL